MQTLTNRDDLESVLGEPVAVLFKYSTRCPISAAAMNQIALLGERRPDLPIYAVDVNDRRSLSDEIADVLGTPHDSPQAFILTHGTPVWHASHYAITARSLEAGTKAGRGLPPQGGRPERSEGSALP